MNKKLLCAALLGGLSVTQVAAAQEFDDRWYLTGSAGFNIQDNDRGTRDTPFVALGVGKFLNQNWSIDGELNYQNTELDDNQDLRWSQYGASLDARYFFTSEGREWAPYILMGLGWQRDEEEFDAFPDPNSPGDREDNTWSAKAGLGVQSGLYGKRVGIRAELAYRADFDDGSVNAPSEDWFGDVLASVGVIIPLGPPVVPAPPAPAAPSCADMDDDGDGVNNCDDKCPGSQAGQTIGPDGCPVPVSIDLKGVNFDFDKAALRPDAIATLNEAIEIFKRYPELRAEVAGHTDQCGKDAYNQKLSERRAKAVYDHLTSNGIDASRLTGPNGYGESRPLEDLGQTMPGCKSEKNRRTELNVQN
ncbi:OOP family OmpA-OmpF porin [Lysobacter niastensis]|uniref:OOP family OmpA-OmpF porin n=1 Tax=Lysobacter niastensis TaxID=380629 RepID=A0ABU1WBN1_9GAMM|nr:OmpA family protein [Lysobacter niastensis]MDR7134792.1 OOP family OmpA-OmpF porin [Lysobacter niastensis]